MDKRMDSQKREEQLWRRMELPLRLETAIASLTKSDMDAIRQTLDLPGISTLRKADLAKALIELIPQKVHDSFMRLDEVWYTVVKETVKNGYFIAPDILNVEAEVLIHYGLVFPGMYRGEKALFMPVEIKEVFLQTDGPELIKKIKRNTEWIKLTHGLLHFYGVFDVWSTYKKVMEMSKQDASAEEYIGVMHFAADIYGQVRLTFYGYVDTRVQNAKQLLDEHKKRTDMNYYPFTKEQLIHVFNPKNRYKSKEEKALRLFLTDYYDMESEDLDEIIWELETMINQQVRPTALVEFLNSILEFPSFEFVQELAGYVFEFYNHTRQWELKGYSPVELKKTL